MREKFENVVRKGGPARGLLTIFGASALFLAFLVVLTGAIYLIMR